MRVVRTALLRLISYSLIITQYTNAKRSGEAFPVRRPLKDLREAASQNVGRDGPRYPDEGFLRYVRTCRADHTPDNALNNAQRIPSHSDDCTETYTILTTANDVAMKTVVPLLLESLHQINYLGKDGKPGTLSQHTIVMGVTREAVEACQRLVRLYHHTCATDGASGLANGDHQYPDYMNLAFGMAKLKYIVNALTTNTDVLYVDADTIFLRNPFPEILASPAHIAVATAPAPCGSPAVEWTPTEEAEEEDTPENQQPHNEKPQNNADSIISTPTATQDATGTGTHILQRAVLHINSDPASDPDLHTSGKRLTAATFTPTATTVAAFRAATAANPSATGASSSALRYSTGVTFYRAHPGVLRCAYSLLLELSNLATAGTVAAPWEQERFAAFMPMCLGSLGLQLTALPADTYPTLCGAGGSGDGSSDSSELEAAGAAAAVSNFSLSGDAMVVHVTMSPGTPFAGRVALMKRVLGQPLE